MWDDVLVNCVLAAVVASTSCFSLIVVPIFIVERALDVHLINI